MQSKTEFGEVAAGFPEKRLVKILELIQIEQYVPVSRRYQWTGRPIKEREAIARAFIAKALLRYQHTSALRNTLLSTPNLHITCGFSERLDVPSESTFSRAFAQFAASGLGTEVHDALVKENLSTELIGHISRDSSAIIGREKPAKKVKAPRHLRLQRNVVARPKEKSGQRQNVSASLFL